MQCAHGGVILLIFTEIELDSGEVEILASATAEDVDYIVAGGLKVRGRIESLGDKNLALLAVVLWLVKVANHYEPVR